MGMKTYNWKRADTAEARERLKELLDNREEVIIRWFGNKHPLEYAVLMDADRRSSFYDGHDYYKIGDFSIDSDFWMTSRTLNDLEFLDPMSACPPLKWEEIHAVGKDGLIKRHIAIIFGENFLVLKTGDKYAATYFGDSDPDLGTFDTPESAKDACEARWANLWRVKQ